MVGQIVNKCWIVLLSIKMMLYQAERKTVAGSEFDGLRYPERL